MNMLANLVGFKKKPKPEIPRHEISEYGEPKYSLTHKFTLENYREYNDAVSKDTIARDKVLKRNFAIILGVIALVFLVLSVMHFDWPEYHERGRSFLTWICYSGFTFYFFVFAMTGYLSVHLATYYKFFPKRLEKATQEYYERTPYLTHDLTLAIYEDGVLEKSSPRDEFFEWELFNRCWDSENNVYLEFNLANQLFVSKASLEENGINYTEMMEFCNEHIEKAKELAAEREAMEEEEEEEEEKEFEENQKKIAELESESESSEE